MNTDNQYEGTVKYYSQEKGFGFIGSNSPNLSGDTWFHVTMVYGENPPRVGQKVTFSVTDEIRKGRHTAREVSIRHELPIKKDTPSLGGFPCIRGGDIRGFVLKRDLGNIQASHSHWHSYETKLQAQNALISLAKSMGANAIFYYRWTVVHDDSYLFWPDPPKYSAEGNAVLLVPVER